jgi:hypothetical protein
VLDALEKQAERDKDFATVAEALERGPGLARRRDAPGAVLQKLGSVYSDRIARPVEGEARGGGSSISSPGIPKRFAFCATASREGDYDGLSELYAQRRLGGARRGSLLAADKATDAALKIDLSLPIGGDLRAALKAPERAFRAYERVLSVAPDDARAASALVPLYEKDEKWARLPALYEVLLAG